MRASELRIGNIVFSHKDGGLIVVQYIPIDIDMRNYGAVKLSEEILLKFGFNKEYQKGCIGIDVCNSDFVLTEPLNLDTFSCKESFISAIEANGYYWGENPIKKPRVIEYDAFNPLMMESHDKNVKKYKEAESKTLKPEKTLIFEII